MSCENIVGVKNILLTFKNCDTNQIVGPISHQLSSEEIPRIRAYDFTHEDLPGGYMKRKHNNQKLNMKVIRDTRIPLKDYQGRSAISVQIEYDNGLVYTGLEGGVRGDMMSDTHEVELELSFRVLEELLPPGALLAA